MTKQEVSMKFKVGDVLLYKADPTFSPRKVTEITKRDYRLTYSAEDTGTTFSHGFVDRVFELDRVYHSPLMQALR